VEVSDWTILPTVALAVSVLFLLAVFAIVVAALI
jgi:hypothetical protein